MELKINKIENYNEDVQQAIKEFEKTVLNNVKDTQTQELIKQMIECFDKFINAINVEDDTLNKSAEMCALTTMVLMAQDSIDKYTEDIPNQIKKILQELIDKM